MMVPLDGKSKDLIPVGPREAIECLNARENAGARQWINASQDTQSLTPDAAQLICLQSLMWAIIAILIATQEKAYEDRPDDVG